VPVLQIDETELCRIAARHDTDKDASYTRVYYNLLAPIREEPLRVLEIGVYNGGSLRMWREFLPNATIFAIDVDPRCLAVERELPNTTVYLVDQGSKEALSAFVDETGGEFDFIVDDGGHTMVQQIASFETIFAHVADGGAYVIEDIGTAYWYEYGGRDIGRPGTSVALVKKLVDAVQLGDILRPVAEPQHGHTAVTARRSHRRRERVGLSRTGGYPQASLGI
jgi:predicted O-methyltransferase YrrM